MLETPKGLRLHISIFGRTNVGKSTLLNTIIGQDLSVVSEKSGTTTDPVSKSMELLPIGPVVFTDTAGLADNTVLGDKRMEKTHQVINYTDIAIIVSDYQGWADVEVDLFFQLKAKNIPVLVVITKNDLQNISDDKLKFINQYSSDVLLTSTEDKNSLQKIKTALVDIIPADVINQPSVLDGLVKKNDVVVLVIPVDKEAPKGRLILPQVQTLRELLDIGAQSIVVKDTELESALYNLKQQPNLVITDSQVFAKVNQIVPKEIKLTSFSVIFARMKGDIKSFIDGAKNIDMLENNDKILIVESCTHHAVEDDIARVKIPKWLKEKTDKNLIFEYIRGHEFPQDLSSYKLIIHCGACMVNRKELLNKIMIAERFGVPITNYGLTIAFCKGIMDRVTSVFSS